MPLAVVTSAILCSVVIVSALTARTHAAGTSCVHISKSTHWEKNNWWIKWKNTKLIVEALDTLAVAWLYGLLSCWPVTVVLGITDLLLTHPLPPMKICLVWRHLLSLVDLISIWSSTALYQWWVHRLGLDEEAQSNLYIEIVSTGRWTVHAYTTDLYRL